MVPSVVVHRDVAGVPASVTVSMFFKLSKKRRRGGGGNEYILSICFFLIGAYASLWCVF